MNILYVPKTIGVISGLNVCANFFQWVTSAISSLKNMSNETQNRKLQGDIHQLHSDLQCLTDTLPAMYNLINRAEWRIHDHYVAEILPRLKDIVYDAEDLLDEFRWYETKVSVEGNAVSVELVIDFFQSVTQGSFSKVTGIQKRLDNISGQLEKVGLLQAIPRFDKSFRPETTSFPNEAKIFGRGKEKKKLMRLLGVPTNNSTCLSKCKRTSGVQVLPIVGIGGVGKTTLAQDICNHSEVKRHFDPIIWICVSDDFDVKRLTKEALEQSISPKKVPQTSNLNSLQLALANSVNKKRFLIVLDDMWDENEQQWKRFCAPFKNVPQGSMMLVTTRSPKVAHVVRTIDLFPLEGLDEDVFRKFFKICVFGSDSSNNNPELVQIGQKILPKLRGSPLAAKTLGRLLGMSLDIAHWDRILKSQLWELRQEETDILPALRLSYMYLPFYLKRCFSICAVYPKDYKFGKEQLVEIWVAEGLVEHHPNILLHHTGGQYFEELAHLSFFQKDPRDHEKYVIHDLMHDMAQLVSKDECFIVRDKNDLPKIPRNVRHLSVLGSGDVQCFDLLKHDMAQHRKLRTLFCHLSLKSETGNNVMEKWCNELLCMRVMVCSISKWGLPGSISNMKLLRYLKILNSSLCKSLPSTFYCLYNMQIFYAKNWEIGDIPNGFVKLISLQKFESVKLLVRHISSLDIHIGATHKEQRRQLMIRNYNGESPLCGFHGQNLANITFLVLRFCYNVKSIQFSLNSEQMHGYNRNDNTFSSLTHVEIDCCQNLSSLEQFLQPAYVPFIKRIQIANCRSLESVPTHLFGDFCFLEVLSVFWCPKIKAQCLYVPSLKKLDLTDTGNLGYSIECSSLTYLGLSNYPLESIELQMWNLPLLQELEISHCPSLRIFRDSYDLSLRGGLSHIDKPLVRFPFLTHLTIKDCDKLQTIDGLLPLPGIKSILIWKCGLLSLPTNSLGGFPRLKDLDISVCQNLNWQSGMLLPIALQKLTLCDCGDFSVWFPSCLEKLTSLKELQVCYCECIVSVPGHLWSSNLKSLQRLKFDSCPKLKSIGGPHTIAHIKDLFIDKCPELKEIDQPLRKRRRFLC